MRRYLLDTSPLAALLRGRPAAVALIRPWMVRHEATTSVVVYAEAAEYAKGLPNPPRYLSALKTLLREIRPYYLRYTVLERYGDIRRQLRPPYGPGLIGDMDMLIAATALEHDLTLVTADSDFQRVPGLKVMLVPSRF